MAKTGKIRWTADDEKELRDAVRRYNRKIAKVAKRQPELAEYQPSRINVAQAIKKAKSGTRKGYKEMLKHIEQYNKPGAEAVVTTEAGVTTTIYQVTENKRAAAAINAYKRAGLKKAEENASPYKGTMGRARENDFRPIKDRTQDTAPNSFEAYSRSLEERLMRFKNNYYEDLYKQNYLEAVRQQFGVNSRLYKLVQDMSADDLSDLWYKDAVTDISFVYDANPNPSKAQVNDHENYILDRFASYGYEYADVPSTGYRL